MGSTSSTRDAIVSMACTEEARPMMTMENGYLSGSVLDCWAHLSVFGRQVHEK